MKTALIVIDGATVGKFAGMISASLKGYKTTIRQAQAYVGTDILPADIFFLGCETSEPASFSYIAKMLQHINLSGRCCGIYATDSKVLKYLSKLVKDSGVNVGETLLVNSATTTSALIKKWTQSILNDFPES